MNAKSESGVDLADYLAILRRRRVALALPIVFILAAAVVVAYTIPPTYQAQATILIERQEIPADLIETTVTGYVEERIQGITQRLLTHENLKQVADRIGFDRNARERGDVQEMIARMREGIEVQMVDVQTSNPGNGKQAVATVAFTIAFDARQPQVAQQGANALADLYLAEERRARVAQAKDVSRFLEAEARRLSVHISELEKELAAFKQENVENLPELADLNLRLMEQTDEKLERTEERIQALEERKLLLESQLVMTEPAAPIYGDDGRRLLSASERLSVLRAEYLAASARYAPGHPDLARLQREIGLLEQQGGASPGTSELFAQLQQLRAQLAESRERYSESHPDVKKLQRSIATLEKELQESAQHPPGVRAALSKVPDNPAFIRLQTELDAVVADIKAERARYDQLQKKRETFEKRLFQTPMVERDYLTLSRDYKTALEKYREVKDKLLRAQSAEQLEQGEKAQRFALIGPAVLPAEPYKPNRLGIVLLGAVLAMGGGLGTASLAEYRDRSVRGGKGIEAVFGAPPLAVIPYIENDGDRLGRRLSRLRWTLSLVVLVIGVLTALHLYWMPLNDILSQWGDIQSKEATKAEGRVVR